MQYVMLMFFLQPAEHTATVCAAMLDRSGPVTVCMDRRVVVRWEVRR